MDVEEIAPHLWHWSAPHPDWKPTNRGKDGQGWDQMVSSYALVGDDAFVLIDPQVPDRREPTPHASGTRSTGTSRLTVRPRSSSPSISTCGAPRTSPAATTAARSGRRRTPFSARGKLDRTRTYATGDELPAGIRVFDVGMPGERALYLPSHKAIVFGDAVLDGVRLLPESWLEKGMTRQDVADALRPLLDEDIELVLLTHGGPVSDRPREQLERALAPA